MTTAISEKAWSDYKKSDYSIAQWHQACLIHLHQGEPTSKEQCKLPIRTPQGVLNRNGVHAAAAALAGARGGVKASPGQMATAKAALKKAYAQLDEQAPSSLQQSAASDETEEFISHYGTKGMKWGVRKENSGPRLLPGASTSMRVGRAAGNAVNRSRAKKADREAPSEDAKRVGELHSRVRAQRSTKPLSNKELELAIRRMNLEQQYSKLSGGNDKTAVQKGRGIVQDFLKNALKVNSQQAFNGQVKDVMDQKLKQGRYANT